MKALISIPALLFFSLALAVGSKAASRQLRYAQMEATYASGFYQPTRGGVLSMQFDEGGNPFSLTISVPGRKLTARVWDVRHTKCGDRILARLSVPNDGSATDLQLADYSNVRCRLYVQHKWRATISTQEADGSESRLEMWGDPQGL